MTMDDLSLPDLRAAAVRDLVERARTGEVALIALAGPDLCVLGGPRHAVFPETMAEAWLRLDPGKRQEYTEMSTARLLEKGYLIEDPDTRADGAAYAMSPELGIIIAARSRPAYAVVGQREGNSLPLVSMFPLGDESDPDQAVVAEYLIRVPFAQDRDEPSMLTVLGVLGCVYKSVLVSPGHAASLLARWAIDPTPKPHRWSRRPDRFLTRYNPLDDQNRAGFRIAMRGDGTIARVTGLDAEDRTASRECDRSELECVMADLLSGDLR